MKILLIGALNKIGINYINYYVSMDRKKYICIDNDTTLYNKITIKEELQNNFQFIKKVINKQNIEDILINNNINRIINFYDLKEGRVEDLEEANVNFVKELYDLKLKYNILHLTHLSTVNVYGSRNFPVKEHDDCLGKSLYLKSKIKSDNFLKSKEGVSVLRLTEVFGLINSNSYIDKVINSMILNLDLTIEEDSDFIRPYIDIYDCMFFINTISNNKVDGLYNISSDYNLTAKNIITLVSKMFDYDESRINYSSSVHVEDISIKVDGSIICNTLKYRISDQEEKLLYFLNKLKFFSKIKDISENVEY